MTFTGELVSENVTKSCYKRSAIFFNYTICVRLTEECIFPCLTVGLSAIDQAKVNRRTCFKVHGD